MALTCDPIGFRNTVWANWFCPPNMNSKSTLSSWYKQILPLNAFSLGARVVFAFSLIADSLTISNRSNNSYRTNKDNNNNNNNNIRVSPTRFWDSPSQTNLRSIVNIRDSWMKNETWLPELRSNLQIVVVWLSGQDLRVGIGGRASDLVS